MGADVRPPALTLIERLQSQPHRFDLFQAISLLERMAPERLDLGTGVGHDESAKLCGNVSLAFAPSDVVSVCAPTASDPRPTLTSAAMSLAGGDGPLPVPFTEMLLQRRPKRDRAALDFLDIFHNRWLAFLYRSRKKHNLGLNWRGSQTDNPIAKTLDALSGLGRAEGARGPHYEIARLGYAGLQNAAPRSMVNLITMLSDRLGLKITGHQFIGGWQPLLAVDTPPLGRAVIGRKAVLGQRAWDAAAGIEITVNGLPFDRLQALLPGGKDHTLMEWLVRRFSQSELRVRLVIHTEPQPTSALPRLGQAQIGWTTWVVAPNATRPRIHLCPIVTQLQAGSDSRRADSLSHDETRVKAG